MKSDMVEKRIFEVDGDVLEGLVSIDEPTLEKGVVEVPGLKKITPVANGVKKIPAVNAVYKITRNSKTLKFLQTWFELGEHKDCVLIRTDQDGIEFARELWPNVELSKLNGPAYDASSPVFAQQMVTLLPEDIIPVAGE